MITKVDPETRSVLPKWSLLLSAIWVAAITSLAAAQCNEGWLPGEQPQGFSGDVTAMIRWDPDGDGPQPAWLVIASNGEIPGLSSPRVAAWDGSTWHSMGIGFSGDGPKQFIVYHGELYACGRFNLAPASNVRNLVRWSGSQWIGVGASSPSNDVNAMAVYNDELYVAGSFGSIAGVSYNQIARWNGTTFSPVASGLGGTVFSLCVYNDRLYAGGTLTTAGEIPVNKIASWDGHAWGPVGGGIGPTGATLIRCMATFNGELYVGGSFYLADNDTIIVSNIAKWNGAAWAALGQGASAGTSTVVWAMKVFDNQLWVASTAGAQGGPPDANLITWDGTSWSGFGNSVFGYVFALEEFESNLYFGGNITSVAGYAVLRVARFDGELFRPMTMGLSGTPYAFALYNNKLIIGGDLPISGTTPLHNLTFFDGEVWQPVGAGTDAPVRAMTTFEGDLVAAGEFASAGGQPAAYIARWNGVAWTPMPGLDGRVNALLVSEGHLYAGGVFTARVAVWNGSGWTQVGVNAPNSTVYTLASFEGNIYAGGAFTMVGQLPAHYITKLSENVWRDVAQGFDGTVKTLAVHQGSLFAGGTFRKDSSLVLSLNGVARLGSANWEPLDTGIAYPTTVNVLASFAGELVATGVFSSAGNTGAASIARWNGSHWRNLGAGLKMSSSVVGTGNTLMENEGLLYVGGSFALAGTANFSQNIAQWFPGSDTFSIVSQPADVNACADSTSTFTVQVDAAPAASYMWRKNAVVINDGRGVSGARTPSLTIAHLQPEDIGVYDCAISSTCGVVYCRPATLNVDATCGPGCDLDINGDGATDAADIEAFVNALAGGECH